MVGDDACSVCASLIQKLLEFIANMERNKQFRKDSQPPKKPKIKTGKLSKKNFEKLQQLGMNFEYLPISKDLMPQFEANMKKMGGTFLQVVLRTITVFMLQSQCHRKILWVLPRSTYCQRRLR